MTRTNRTSPTRQARLLSQRQWFALHSWLGLKFAILLSVVLVSGTVATLGHEIHWLVNPILRVEPGAKRASWGEIVESIRTRYPDRHVSTLRLSQSEHFALEAMTRTPERAIRYVYVDPYTGEINGDTYGYNVRLFLRHLHRFLFLGGVGVYIVGFFSFFLIASLVSGLLVYKKFWRGFFRLPRRTTSRVVWGGAHKLAGLWSIWFLAVIAATGAWYFAEQLLKDAGRRVSLPRPEVTDAMLDRVSGGPLARIGVNEAVRIAEAELPGLEIETITLPSDVHDPIRLSGRTGALLAHDTATAVYVNPFDGSVLESHRAEELGVGMRLIESANPLHFGDFGGLTTKLVWFAFGLLLSGLAISGAVVWVKRTRRSLSDEGRTPAMMGRWKYANFLFLVPAPFLAIFIARLPGPVHANGPVFPPRPLGSGTASLAQVDAAEPGRSVTFFVDLSDSLARRVRTAFLSVAEAQPAAWGEEAEIHDLLGKPVARVSLPQRLSSRSSLWLMVQTLDGRRETVSWPLGADREGSR